MKKRGIVEWVNHDKIKQILFCFSTPKTPRRVEKELGLKKLKLKPFMEKQLLESLNPKARKGRFYVLTNRARKLINLSEKEEKSHQRWDIIGFIMSSPKQRLVVLKFVDFKKRNSEEIREKASQLNPHLSRTSTKGILKELINAGLAKTEMLNGKRYYWISKKGLVIKNSLNTLSPVQ